MDKKIEKELEDSLKVFAPISLSQLNASVSFLKRIDTKYLVHVKDLAKIVEELEKDYFVLDIKGVRIFDYDNIYMDSKALDFYYAHERGDDVRVKVRTRYYVDSDLCFFEYKHKEGDLVRKFRYQEDSSLFGKMDPEATRFFTTLYGSLMDGAEKITISPTMRTTYKRFTLCSKANDERITIDLDLSFSDPTDVNSKVIELPHLAIIEAKSSQRESRSSELMKKFDIQRATGCSKYCLGLIYFDRVTSHEKFDETLQTIEKLWGKASISRVLKKQDKQIAKSTWKVNLLKDTIQDPVAKESTKKPIKKTIIKRTKRSVKAITIKREEVSKVPPKKVVKKAIKEIKATRK